MRTLLCLVLFLCSGWVGIQRSAEFRRKPMLLLSLADSLSILQTEICVRKAPLQEALLHSSESFKNLKTFYQMLLIGAKADQAFSIVWHKAVLELYPYRGEEQHALLALGKLIGRYDAQTQETAFLTCIQVLRSGAMQIKTTSRTNARLAIGLSTVCGLLLAIAFY